MRFGIYFLLFVSACYCDISIISKNITKPLVLKRHQHGNKTSNCKRLNCPITEEQKCVKIMNKNLNNPKEIHIIVLNKCEIDYIKCHDGLEATLVPMKDCENPKIGYSDKKRSKRSPKIATSKNNVTIKSRRYKIPYKSNRIDYSKLYFGPQRRDNSDEDSVEEDPEESENTAVDEEIKITVEGNMSGEGSMSFRADEDEVNSLDGPEPDDDGSDDQENESDDHDNDDDSQGNDGQENDSDDQEGDIDGEASEVNVKLDIDKEELKDSKSEPKLVDTAGFNDDDDGPHIEGVHIQYLAPPQPNFGQPMATSIQIADRNKEVEVQNAKIDSSAEVSQKEKPETSDRSDSDINEYTQTGDCPTECPAREVMVCARCKAGVYRTFLSVCHLRLFSCNHPDEKLELVSRRPCIFSAPFLTGMKTKGKQKDPNDDDIVLKYIQCREKGDNYDPKCKFAKIDKKDKR